MRDIRKFLSIFIIVFIITACSNSSVYILNQENMNVINKEDIEIKRIERSIYGYEGKPIAKVYYEQPVIQKDTKIARIINSFFEEEENTMYNNQLKNDNIISIKNVMYNNYSSFLESVFMYYQSLGEERLSDNPLRYSVDTKVILCNTKYLSISQTLVYNAGGPVGIKIFGTTFDINTGELVTLDKIVNTDADRFRDIITDFINNTDIFSPEYRREEAYEFYKKNAEHNYRVNSDEDILGLDYSYYYDGEYLYIILNNEIFIHNPCILKWNGKYGKDKDISSGVCNLNPNGELVIDMHKGYGVFE